MKKTTQSAEYAASFSDFFSEKFATTTTKNPSFVITVDEFDDWLVNAGFCPSPTTINDVGEQVVDDLKQARLVTQRNCIRGLMNVAAGQGDHGADPFEVAVEQHGSTYRVRNVVELCLLKPQDIGKRLLSSLRNKGSDLRRMEKHTEQWMAEGLLPDTMVKDIRRHKSKFMSTAKIMSMMLDEYVGEVEEDYRYAKRYLDSRQIGEGEELPATDQQP